MSAPSTGPASVPNPPRKAISATVRSNSGLNAVSGSACPMKNHHRPPIMPVIPPEITNAMSLIFMVRTPRPRARSSSSRMASSWRPNREFRISQDSAMVSHRDDQPDVVEGVVVVGRGPQEERRAHALVPAGEAEVERHQLEDEEERDRDHHERVPPDPQRDQPQRHRDQRGHQAAQRQQREDVPAGELPVVGQQAHGVGAGAEEHRVAERDVAGVAGEQVPGRHGAHVDHGVHGELGVQRVGDDQREDRRDHQQDRQEAQPDRRGPAAAPGRLPRRCRPPGPGPRSLCPDSSFPHYSPRLPWPCPPARGLHPLVPCSLGPRLLAAEQALRAEGQHDHEGAVEHDHRPAR